MVYITIIKSFKYMRILIPNATGPTNIGDQAILEPLIKLIKTNYPKSTLTIHSSVPKKYKVKIADELANTLYSWAAFENRNILIRIYRVLTLFISYLSFRTQLNWIWDKQLLTLITDYLKADMIVFVGGGYLRSQKGLTQSLNQTLPFIG